MPVIYIGLGTNLGDRLANLREAISRLPPRIQVTAESPIYETPPWGMTDQPAFLNMAVKCETSLKPLALLTRLKRIEVALGRTASVRWGPRLIDMDILFYSELVLETPELCIPHPRLHERAFVLVPLADIAPDLVHPVLGKSVSEMLADCKSEGIKPYDNGCS